MGARETFTRPRTPFSRPGCISFARSPSQRASPCARPPEVCSISARRETSSSMGASTSAGVRARIPPSTPRAVRPRVRRDGREVALETGPREVGGSRPGRDWASRPACRVRATTEAATVRTRPDFRVPTPVGTSSSQRTTATARWSMGAASPREQAFTPAASLRFAEAQGAGALASTRSSICPRRRRFDPVLAEVPADFHGGRVEAPGAVRSGSRRRRESRCGGQARSSRAVEPAAHPTADRDRGA